MIWLSYLLKVIACQACFLFVFQLLVKPAGRHHWSRFYLCGVLVLSFLVPLNQFQIHTEQVMPLTLLEEELVVPIEQVITKANHSTGMVKSGKILAISIQFILFALYLVTTGVLLVKFFMNLKVIISHIKKRSYVKTQGIKLYESDHLAPFSFFTFVFLPREMINSNVYKQVMIHELAHARHWHSLDRILIDLIVALLWFNPFIYWYRNALKAVHEYQADEFVLRRFPDKIAYQEILFLQLFKPAFGLANHFNTSLIKKRIVMMNQRKMNIYRWLPLFSIPVILCLSVAFSLKEVNAPMEIVLKQHLDLGPDTALWTTFELPQEESIPDIYPISKDDRFRLTSGFGIREDPRSKKRAQHQGIDISAPIGTEVYATADGVVITAEKRPEGFGTIVEISHRENGKLITRYAHLDSFVVKLGQKVKKGDLIASVGSSGWSLGPHIHYEIRVDGKAVNPEKYIKNDEL